MPTDDQRIRVLFITHSISLAGAAVSLNLLLETLDPDRYERVVACIYAVPEVMEYHAKAGARVIAAPNIMDFPHTTGGWWRAWNPRHVFALGRAVLGYKASVRATRSLVREVDPDIVHLNSLILVSAAEGTRKAGVPLVWHVRESIVDGHTGLRKRWIIGKVRTLPDAVIFLSEDDMRRLGPPSTSWHVVPNWTSFDPPRDRAGARERLSLSPDAPVVLFLGGFNRLKGADTLLRAFPTQRLRKPDAVCLIASVSEPSRRPIARISRALLTLVGVRSDIQVCRRLLEQVDGVVTLPFQQATDDLFAAASVLVFPAREPHFPRPIIEAFAHRIPVVASDLGPIREVTGAGTLGILVRPDDPRELAEALSRALSGGVEIDAMIEAAFRTGRMRFSPDAGGASIKAIYREVLP